jgi:thiol-disulfide isomerase/thioredoxin
MAFRLLLTACLGICFTPPLSAAKPETDFSPLGQKVAGFSLKDYRGKTHQLSDYAHQKLLVIVYLGTECPLAKLYAPRLASLSEKYAGQGVAFWESTRTGRIPSPRSPLMPGFTI